MNTPGTQRVMYGNDGHTDAADCRTAGRSDFPNLRLSGAFDLREGSDIDKGLTELP